MNTDDFSTLAKHLLSLNPLVTHKAGADVDYLDWLAKQVARKLDDDPYPFIRLEERRATIDANRLRKPTVTVLDCPQLPRGEIRSAMQQRDPSRNWLHELVDGGQGTQLTPDGGRVADSTPPQLILACNPEDWDGIVRSLERMGYEVANGEAPYTHPGNLWQEALPEPAPGLFG